MRAFADCPDCTGTGVARNACGRCQRCGGEGIVSVKVSEDFFFRDLPPGMTRDDAKALLQRIRDRVEASRAS